MAVGTIDSYSGLAVPLPTMVVACTSVASTPAGSISRENNTARKKLGFEYARCGFGTSKNRQGTRAASRMSGTDCPHPPGEYLAGARR